MQRGRPLSPPENVTDPIDRSQPLPDDLLPIADEYDAVVGIRDRSLWQWLYHVFPAFRLSCVDEDRRRTTREMKLLLSVYVTLTDDVAERHGDRATFDELATIPFERSRVDPERPAVDGDVIRFARRLWNRFRTLYDRCPRSDELDRLLRFDLRQVLRAIEYSSLLERQPALLSTRELWEHDVHNMVVFCYADVDLAAGRPFETSDLATLRDLCAHTQRMARIGNWIASWERELHDGDCSSGVVARALETGVITRGDIRAIQREPTAETVGPIVDAIDDSSVETALLERWYAEYDAASRIVPSLESVDGASYLDGFETILRSHLAVRGEV
ncbi:hypothetical protein [Halopiger goleimassiliensis]|uniref:hypothetical protein n=1 Tax=Halopiger goleimassiliensis TaxID=1293048 RepID=UPI0006778CA3|nr:hypothetical protein [Halopiger goleimassiliensis]